LAVGRRRDDDAVRKLGRNCWRQNNVKLSSVDSLMQD
jgi:hypothetical protein